MTQKYETDPDSQVETAEAIYFLQTDPTAENLMKFLAAAGSQMDLNPKFQFIAAKAKVALGISDPATHYFLLNYFEDIGNVYAAICCAESLLLEDEKNEVLIGKHTMLLADYNDNKKKELAQIRETFIKNRPDVTISIIMPTYNRHQYIGRAIESVMNQTFRDYEIIIVNDGGSRECEAIIESFQSEKIRYLYVEHGGLSLALNHGILASRSKYIAYLDDDDRYFPDHLQTLVSALESSCTFVYSDAFRAFHVYEDNKWNQISKTVELSYDFDPARFTENNYIPILCMAHRRDCFQQIGLFERDLPNAMDWDLWAKAAKLYDFKHLKKVTCIYEYRLGPDSLSGRQVDNLFFGIILRKHHQYLTRRVAIELSNKFGRGLIGYSELENTMLRYHCDKDQIAELLLHVTLAERKWHHAYSFITKLAREHPKRTFFTLRRLNSKISIPAQFFSFFILFFISFEYALKYGTRKYRVTLMIIPIALFILVFWVILLFSTAMPLRKERN